MTRRVVAVLHLGRTQAMGEVRRIDTWQRLLDAAGYDMQSVPLLVDHAVTVRLPRLSDSVALVRGDITPETLAWSPRSVLRMLHRTAPDAIVCITARAYHHVLLTCRGALVLDYVDSLARSYGQRRRIAPAWWRRAGYGLLSWSHRRFEERMLPPRVQMTAAGWADAQRLGTQWLPMVVPDVARIDPARADTDVIFFGSLSYPPNVAAVRRLARIWPELRRRRSSASALIAGARPADEVLTLAKAHGWEVAADFVDLRDVCGRARVAVAPLEHTAGIQSKVIEAAALGLPQVVSSAATAGLAPGLPAIVCDDDGEFAGAVVGLLDDESRRRSLADAAWRHVHDGYSIEAWSPVVSRLVGQPGGGPEA